MKLQAAINSYVCLKQSLGASFRSEARMLRSFARALGDIELAEVSAEQCDAFWRGSSDPTRFWERKYYTLRGLFAFLVARGQLSKSPLREPGPKIRSSFQPHIYSHDELRRLVDQTDSLDDPRSPLQAQTFRCLLLVLYGAGLRASEALRLRCCDTDLRSGLLTIWDSKFFKSRLVPIGAQLQTTLASYDKQRRALLALPRGEESAFFATRTGYRVSLCRLEKTFVVLRARAGVTRPPTDRWQPRLHDLRHYPARRIIPRETFYGKVASKAAVYGCKTTRDNQSPSKKLRSSSLGR
jgi:site-specific recombinase XerD